MNLKAERLPDPVVRSAIDWQLRLRAEPGNTALHQQWQAWRQQDAQHDQAWQRLQQMSGMFHASQLPDATRTIPLLNRAQADLSRRRTLKLLGLGLAVGGSTLLVSNAPPAWRADIATRTGERRQVSLGSNAEVLLNTDSALDIEQQVLVLRSGEVQIQGADWHARCRYAECHGHDARVLLHERDGHSEIRVAQGQVQVSSASGMRSLQAGEALSVSASGMRNLGKGPLDPFAWTRGLLVVNDMRLADFLAEAGRYRHGWLGCDTAVADLRLSGVFHLDEPALMLRNLTHLLPVRIVERTRWWVRLIPA